MQINPSMNISIAYMVPFIGFVSMLFILILFLVFYTFTKKINKRGNIEVGSILLVALLVAMYHITDTLCVYMQNFEVKLVASKIGLSLLLFSVIAFYRYMSVISGDYIKRWCSVLLWAFVIFGVIFNIPVLFTEFLVFNNQFTLIGTDGTYLVPKFSIWYFTLMVPILIGILTLSAVFVVKAYRKMSSAEKKGYTLLIVGMVFLLVSGIIRVLNIFGLSIFQYVPYSFSLGLAVSVVLFGVSTIARLLGANQEILKNKEFLSNLVITLQSLSLKFEEVSGSVKSLDADVVGYSENIINDVNEKKESINKLLDLSVQGKGTIGTAVDIVNKNIVAFESIKKLMTEQKDSIVFAENSLQEIDDSVGKINVSSSNMADSISDLTENIEHGKVLLDKNIEVTANIQQSIEKVFYIVGVIDDISEEINMLAMNASIEAAHAEQFGKGFAVVAEEIRSVSVLTMDKSEAIKSGIMLILEKFAAGTDNTTYINDIFANFSKGLERLFAYILSVIDISKSLQGNMAQIFADLDKLKDIAFSNSDKSEEETELNAQLLELTENVNDFIGDISVVIENEKAGVDKLKTIVENITDVSVKNTQIIDGLNNLHDGMKLILKTSFDE